MQMLFDLYANNPFWVWAAIGGALLAAEVATGSGWLLWPAASAVVVGMLTLFAPLPAPLAIVIFAVITIATSLLGRRFMPRSVTQEGADINDNIARLVGHHGQVVPGFGERTGRVFIDGKEWAAELEEGERLEPGAEVKVTGVDGALLKVRPAR